MPVLVPELVLVSVLLVLILILLLELVLASVLVLVLVCASTTPCIISSTSTCASTSTSAGTSTSLAPVTVVTAAGRSGPAGFHGYCLPGESGYTEVAASPGPFVLVDRPDTCVARLLPTGRPRRDVERCG